VGPLPQNGAVSRQGTEGVHRPKFSRCAKPLSLHNL
jgi:hypothetical protein